MLHGHYGLWALCALPGMRVWQYSVLAIRKPLSCAAMLQSAVWHSCAQDVPFMSLGGRTLPAPSTPAKRPNTQFPMCHGLCDVAEDICNLSLGRPSLYSRELSDSRVDAFVPSSFPNTSKWSRAFCKPCLRSIQSCLLLNEHADPMYFHVLPCCFIFAVDAPCFTCRL